MRFQKILMKKGCLSTSFEGADFLGGFEDSVDAVCDLEGVAVDIDVKIVGCI